MPRVTPVWPQVFALSDYLGVALPTTYRETVHALRWTIPHAGLPWEKPGLPAISAQLMMSSATGALPPPAVVKTFVAPARKLGQVAEKRNALSKADLVGAYEAAGEEVVPRGRRLLSQHSGIDAWAAPSMSLAQYNEFFEVCAYNECTTWPQCRILPVLTSLCLPLFARSRWGPPSTQLWRCKCWGRR